MIIKTTGGNPAFGYSAQRLIPVAKMDVVRAQTQRLESVFMSDPAVLE